MALGLIHVRGRLCKYASKASGNRRASAKAGKFVQCRPAGKRGWVVDKRSTKPKQTSTPKPSSKRKAATTAKGGMVCRKLEQRMFGKGAKKVCREVCWSKGKIVSNKPSKGCK